MDFISQISQKLLFVLGKGGVGKTTVSASLAASFAAKGNNVLYVQWALSDALSPLYSLPECSHKESPLLPLGIQIMNFSPRDAVREYFVEHLKMKLLYSVIIENKHVQKLIQAAPGIQELFFLGRLFWLVELAEKEKGYKYDKIIVDSPSTGHGVSLFSIAPTVAQFGVTGPLASECERVAKLLADQNKTGTIFVTLPEELPVEESIETLPKINKILGRPPLFICLNQSLQSPSFPKLTIFEHEEWFLKLTQSLIHSQAKQELMLMANQVVKRIFYENKLREWVKKWNNCKSNVLSLPDVTLFNKNTSPAQVIKTLTYFFSNEIL